MAKVSDWIKARFKQCVDDGIERDDDVVEVDSTEWDLLEELLPIVEAQEAEHEAFVARMETEMPSFREQFGRMKVIHRNCEIRRDEARALLQRFVKYIIEDKAVTPHATRLDRLVDQVADYLRRTHDPASILRLVERDEKADAWIPFAERMPEPPITGDKRVLLCRLTNEDWGVFTNDDYAGWLDSDGTSLARYKSRTHWRLITPPEVTNA